MTRFNKERLQISELFITMVISALTNDVKGNAFKMSLSKFPMEFVTGLFMSDDKYINMEETIYPKKNTSTQLYLLIGRPLKILTRSDCMSLVESLISHAQSPIKSPMQNLLT
ncbi:hypothetical protein Fot_41933 [Forsythia ovata]|uniref:Uncharacterized protein n=1 Tax=Forsythia ovata TaxID=205694 RepID=A0ABD1RKG6_9LAMI